MVKDRIILHSDLNNFYATVECAKNPDIANKPVCVSGSVEKRHGIVLAKNGIAKAVGIRTGETLVDAKRKCGDLVIVEANMDEYQKYSKLVKDIYNEYTDHVESFGIDECWLDVSGSTRLFGDGKAIADSIRQSIKSRLNLTVSVGVSWNKVYAKLGSDLKKPDATTVISRQNYKQMLFRLNVRDMLFVGKATAARLDTMGIRTIGDLAAADINYLTKKLGKNGKTLWVYANGLDDSPVSAEGQQRDVKSVSNSVTLFRDLATKQDIELVLTILSESVSFRLLKAGLRGSIISVSVRNQQLKWWSKQSIQTSPLFSANSILRAAISIFSDYDFSQPIRSIGVCVSDLQAITAQNQTDLFGDCHKMIRDELSQISVEKIRQKFGQGIISRGNALLDKQLTDFYISDDD